MIVMSIDLGIKVAECEDRECVCVARVDEAMDPEAEAILLWAFAAEMRGEA